ncbi:MAG: FKBP-type peptidyl-prolyl cis-trans isomerase, partial [Phycisphaerales bacterium]
GAKFRKAILARGGAIDGMDMLKDFLGREPQMDAYLLHLGLDGPKKQAKAVDLPGAPVSGEPVTTDSGLVYYDLVVGDGPQPAGPASRVKVHYTGWLTDGTKFDSSVDRGQPATFPLNRVIRGWTEGVGSMRVGGKRKLVIPYELGYGERGRAPVIPPRAKLIFDVELLEIVQN